MDHHYLESGWCICGKHRDDGTRARDITEDRRLTLAEIRTIRATHEPKVPTT